MDPSAEDGGGRPTALAHDPAAARRVSVPQQRGPAASDAAATGPAPAGPDARRPTDGVAVAALVSGLVPAIPVTLVLGPLALIRVGRSGARGRGLAITGLVLAGLWTVAAAVVAAAIITRPPPPKPVTLPHVFSLRAGQCVDSGTDGISGVHVLSCGQAHDAEVFATFQVAGSRYPGPAALQQRAREGCVEPARRLPQPRAARDLAGAVLRLPGRRRLVGRGTHRGLHRPQHLRPPGRLGAGRTVRLSLRMR